MTLRRNQVVRVERLPQPKYNVKLNPNYDRWSSYPLSPTLLTRAFSFALAVAAIGNTMLVGVTNEDGWFQWSISILSGITAGGMIDRVASKHLQRRHAWASLLSVSLWTSNAVEVITAPYVREISKARLSLLYLSFAVGSAFVYLAQRVILETRRAKVTREDVGGATNVS